jgi:hypothetical protein
MSTSRIARCRPCRACRNGVQGFASCQPLGGGSVMKLIFRISPRSFLSRWNGASLSGTDCAFQWRSPSLADVLRLGLPRDVGLALQLLRHHLHGRRDRDQEDDGKSSRDLIILHFDLNERVAMPIPDMLSNQIEHAFPHGFHSPLCEGQTIRSTSVCAGASMSPCLLRDAAMAVQRAGQAIARQRRGADCDRIGAKSGDPHGGRLKICGRGIVFERLQRRC